MYTRNTELRRLHERDEYNLALKLNERDVCRLMEIIPHRINTQQCSNNGTLDWKQALNKDGRKYRHEHFELMKNAFRASGGTRLISQILLDEWKTSGRREERPTLGVLLQLLVGAECWMAADFLATELLHEPKPDRPLDGPAARFDFPISEICDEVEDYVNDISNYPNTEDLSLDVNGFNSMNNNRDYRTKFIFEKQVLNAKTNDRDKSQTNLAARAHTVSRAELVNGMSQSNIGTSLIYSTELNNTTSKNTQNDPIMMVSTTNTTAESADKSTLTSSRYIPLISTLMTRDNTSAMSQSISSTAESSCATPSATTSQVYTFFSEVQIPNISFFSVTGNADEIVEDTQTKQTGKPNASSQINESIEIPNEVLPQLHDNDDIRDDISSSSNSNSSISNNETTNNEIDVEYVPNLSIFEQTSPNNDSSLTSVTGTSGENSFEMSSIQDEQEIAFKTKNILDDVQNEIELISQENIPCLSALKN